MGGAAEFCQIVEPSTLQSILCCTCGKANVRSSERVGGDLLNHSLVRIEPPNVIAFVIAVGPVLTASGLRHVIRSTSDDVAGSRNDHRAYLPRKVGRPQGR